MGGKRPPGRLRIIGGRWRSRLIDFDPAGGVRPTPDRVRQTLFDWLAPRIEGAVCLDLFAGSGALGLEALSRGARQVCFVESGHAQAGAIRATLARLGTVQGEVVEEHALHYLARTGPHCEIVFVDPPYDSALLEPVLGALPRVLKPESRIYLEWPAGRPPALPPGYLLLREKQAGQVSYGLLTYAQPQGAAASA